MRNGVGESETVGEIMMNMWNVSVAMLTVLILCAGCNRPSEATKSIDPRLQLPKQSAYSNKREFLRARIEYYTTEWVKRNPDKPYHFVAAVPITEVTEGVWGMETGQAVVSGDGLFVTVDDSGNLIEIKEIFNPD